MNKVLLFPLLFLLSCNSFYKKEELIANFENTLRLKISLENNFNENLNFTTGKLIERPPGSWQNLISSDHFCLNYKIPIDKMKGTLQIVQKEKNRPCPKLPVSKEVLSIDGISNLKIKYTTDHIQGKTIRNGIYGISMEYSFYKSKRELSIILPNKMRGKSYIKSKLVKYASSGTFRLDKGVRVTEGSRKNLKTSLWETSGESEIIFCEKKNLKCEITRASSCDECLNGWEYLVDYNCEGGGSKACSPIDCGKKGRPACPRGIIWSGQNISDLCFDDSPAGFCQDSLSVICGEDGVLICV